MSISQAAIEANLIAQRKALFSHAKLNARSPLLQTRGIEKQSKSPISRKTWPGGTDCQEPCRPDLWDGREDVQTGHPLAKPPQIMGHEFAGTVSEIGTGAGNFRVGMKVVSANSAPCNKCFYCLMHQPNLCERLDESMIGFTWPGSYAEYVRIPERIVRQNTFQVPDGVPLESVASLEPLACVVHGWDLVGQVPGGTAIIIGGGPIGLLHAQLARLNGARQVALCDVVPERLREAEKIGVDTTIDSANENVVERMSSLTDGRGADIVVEAVGRGETWESTIGLVRKGGAILLFGGSRQGRWCPSRLRNPLR